jgi:hypothetical protein
MQQWHKELRPETAGMPGKRDFSEALGETIGLEIIKLATGLFMRIRKMSVKASWRSLPLPKQKKRILGA